MDRARFHSLPCGLVHNPRLLQLGGTTAYVLLYLWTCDHRVTEGLYRLPLGYARADLELVGINDETILESLMALERERFIAHDSDSEVVFLASALHYSPPKSTPDFNWSHAAPITDGLDISRRELDH
jgi:hypothetical protein